MRLLEGQPLSFEKYLVMSFQLATVRVFFFACLSANISPVRFVFHLQD